MPRRLKSLLITLLIALIGSGIIMALIQANVQELARVQGWDQYGVKYWGPVLKALHSVGIALHSYWVISSLSFAAGAVVALWIDAILRRREGHFLTFGDTRRKGASIATPRPAEAPPRTREEIERDRRDAFLRMRQRMESPLVGAGGIPFTYQFDENAIGHIEMPQGTETYRVQISKHSGTGVWINRRINTNKTLWVTKAAERGKPVDIRPLRPVRDSSASMEIGDHAFVEFTDGKVAQILLVGVLYYGVGDDRDEARFRYQLHGPGEFLIEAL